MVTPTRERILDGAWRLFLKQGFAGTTISEIEGAASLAKGTGSFYRHFRSKEDVLRAAVDREVDRLDAMRTSGPELDEVGGDVRVVLAIEFQRRLDSLRRLQPLMVLMHREREHLGPSRKRLGESVIGRNLEVRSQRLESWMSQGVIPARDAEALAATVMCALTGYHLSLEFFGSPPGSLKEEEFVSTLVDLVVRG